MKVAIQSGLAYRPPFHIVRWLPRDTVARQMRWAQKLHSPGLGILPGLLGLLSGLTHSLLLPLIILLKMLWSFHHFLGAEYNWLPSIEPQAYNRRLVGEKSSLHMSSVPPFLIKHPEFGNWLATGSDIGKHASCTSDKSLPLSSSPQLLPATQSSPIKNLPFPLHIFASEGEARRQSGCSFGIFAHCFHGAVIS